MNGRFIWNIDQTKKVKVKEIREYSIVFNEKSGDYEVVAYGCFGGGVVLLSTSKKEVCQDFINKMTDTKPGD